MLFYKFKNMIMISSIILCILHNTQMARHSKTGKKLQTKKHLQLRGSILSGRFGWNVVEIPMVIPFGKSPFPDMGKVGALPAIFPWGGDPTSNWT